MNMIPRPSRTRHPLRLIVFGALMGFIGACVPAGGGGSSGGGGNGGGNDASGDVDDVNIGPPIELGDGLPIGAECESSATCSSDICSALLEGLAPICTTACGNRRCPADLTCVRPGEGGTAPAGPGDDGYCTTGAPLGEECWTDGDCASTQCIGAEPGVQGICSFPCERGDCPEGFACDWERREPRCRLRIERALGEPCEDDFECRPRGYCGFFGFFGDMRLCTRSCHRPGSCPDGFWCDGDIFFESAQCSPGGGDGSLGEQCTNGGDCVSEVCHRVDGARICSEWCDGPGSCPDGYWCAFRDFADICEPGDTDGALGDACEDGGDCASEICGVGPDGETLICTQG